MLKFLVVLLFAIPIFANEIYIAAGAGYKRPISELGAIFEKENNIKVNAIFGHLAQVLEQTKSNDKITVVLGDEDFLEKQKFLYSKKVELGRGILVLVFSKNSHNYSLIKDLENQNIKKIGMPDPKKAIYGIAADEFLLNSKLKEPLKDKILVLQTVPQVSSYLISGDIDAGFINKTDYIGIADKVGTAVEVEQKMYSPASIVGVVPNGRENSDTKKFMEFLTTPKAKAILQKYGL